MGDILVLLLLVAVIYVIYNIAVGIWLILDDISWNRDANSIPAGDMEYHTRNSIKEIKILFPIGYVIYMIACLIWNATEKLAR
jgi:hypothetical protein